MSEHLLPCPFCGGEAKPSAVRGIYDLKIADRYYIVCMDCEIQTKYSFDEQSAVAAWNRRPVQAENKTPKTTIPGVTAGFCFAANCLLTLYIRSVTMMASVYTK